MKSDIVGEVVKMPFKSDAELIRHYFEELLSDGREHTIHEVLAYVLSCNGDIGANGKPITYNKVQNALFQFVRSKNCGYIMARRGCYIKEHAPAKPQATRPHTLHSACDNALQILADAEIGIRGCFMSYLSVMEEAGGVNQSLRNTEQAVITSLEQAMRRIKDLKTYRGHAYFSYDDSDA